MKVRGGPDGIHLFDRRTGLNVLVDEVELSPGLWAPAPRQVSIALTNACDLACPYCYAPKMPATLRFDEVTAWLHELELNGCLSVGFGGGEPTLYRRFAELCRYASQATRLAVTLTTHAHHLRDEFAKTLAGNVHFVRVSMDGVGSTYETLRGRSFSALRRSLEIVREIAPFGINFVVNATTLPDLDAAIDVAVEMGAAEFLLLPEQPTRRSAGIDNITSQALTQWVHSCQKKIPLVVSEAGAGGLPTCNPFENEVGLRAYAHIDASGILKRSSYDQEGVTIGAGGFMNALALLRVSDEREQP